MTDLADQLRALTDSAAEPIGLEEVTTRSAPEGAAPPPGPLPRRAGSGRAVLVAAMALFIAGLAGLVWFVSDRSDSTAPVVAGTGALYALPPADAADLQVIFPEDPPFEDQGTFIYDDPTLGQVQLHTSLTSNSGYADARAVAQQAQDSGFDARVSEVLGFGEITIVCFMSSNVDTAAPDGVVVAGDGQAMVRWYGDGISTTLAQDSGGASACNPSGEAPALVQAMKNVRLVTREEWERFIDENRTRVVSGLTSEPTTPVTKPGPAGWCDAIEAFRSSGSVDASTGMIRVDALPYLRTMLAESPPELAPPIQTLITWLEEGAPTPVPAEVGAAELTTTQDWASRCPTG